jgi:hypothetical protein
MKTTRPRARCLGLVLACLLASAPLSGATSARGPDDPKQQLLDIEKEFQAEYKEVRAAAQAAGEDGGEIYRSFSASIVPEFAECFAAVARASAGTELALEGWERVLRLASMGLEGPLVGEAIDVVTRDHITSPSLANLVTGLRYADIDEDQKLAALRTIAAGSPHRATQAAALYSLGAVLGDEREAGDPRIEEAKAVFAKLADYGDVKYRGEQTYAEAAASHVFALENLVVGKPCPDFEAVDVENASFKLSDYKGKVVLIDFWGFW